MASKRKKIKAFGRFGAGYGRNVRNRLNKIEEHKRKAQPCPFHPNCRAKRVAVGIWKCVKTDKVFAGHAYFLKEKE